MERKHEDNKEEKGEEEKVEEETGNRNANKDKKGRITQTRIKKKK